MALCKLVNLRFFRIFSLGQYFSSHFDILCPQTAFNIGHFILKHAFQITCDLESQIFMVEKNTIEHFPPKLLDSNLFHLFSLISPLKIPLQIPSRSRVDPARRNFRTESHGPETSRREFKHGPKSTLNNVSLQNTVSWIAKQFSLLWLGRFRLQLTPNNPQ